MSLRRPGKFQVCWQLSGINVRCPYLTWWTSRDFLDRVLLQVELALPATGKWWRRSERHGGIELAHLYLRVGLRSSCPFGQGVFQPTLNYLETIKFPFQQLGLMERFTAFSFSCWIVITKPSSEFSVKGKVYLGELKGLSMFMPPGLLYG